MTTPETERRYYDAGGNRGEVRFDESAGTVEFAGYATVYDFEYPVFGGPDRGGFIEVVRSGAGAVTLARDPDVRLLIDHTGTPLARSGRGDRTMTLAEDPVGLMVQAPALDLRNPRVAEISSALSRKDVDAMSFAFRVTGQTWNDDFTFREITEYDLVVKGSDVSIVTYPANDATMAAIRAASHVDELRAAATRGTIDVRAARAIADRLRESV